MKTAIILGLFHAGVHNNCSPWP